MVPLTLTVYVLQGLLNNHVYTLALNGNRIAAGTLGGLSLLEDDTVQANYTTANLALRHNWISALAHVGNTGSPELGGRGGKPKGPDHRRVSHP